MKHGDTIVVGCSALVAFLLWYSGNWQYCSTKNKNNWAQALQNVSKVWSSDDSLRIIKHKVTHKLSSKLIYINKNIITNY